MASKMSWACFEVPFGPRRARISCCLRIAVASRALRAVRSRARRDGLAFVKVGVLVVPFVGRETMLKVAIWEIGKIRKEPLGTDAELAGLAVDVLIATRFVIGSAVNRIPSMVEEVGAAVMTRMRAPIAPLNAAFWRLLSVAILMQGSCLRSRTRTLLSQRVE